MKELLNIPVGEIESIDMLKSELIKARQPLLEEKLLASVEEARRLALYMPDILSFTFNMGGDISLVRYDLETQCIKVYYKSLVDLQKDVYVIDDHLVIDIVERDPAWSITVKVSIKEVDDIKVVDVPKKRFTDEILGEEKEEFDF